VVTKEPGSGIDNADSKQNKKKAWKSMGLSLKLPIQTCDPSEGLDRPFKGVDAHVSAVVVGRLTIELFKLIHLGVL